jgi:hypothetical protein
MKANPDKFQAIAIGKKTKNENISFNLNGKVRENIRVVYCKSTKFCKVFTNSF